MQKDLDAINAFLQQMMSERQAAMVLNKTIDRRRRTDEGHRPRPRS